MLTSSPTKKRAGGPPAASPRTAGPLLLNSMCCEGVAFSQERVQEPGLIRRERKQRGVNEGARGTAAPGRDEFILTD